MMRKLGWVVLAISMVVSRGVLAEESVVRQFLQYQYGHPIDVSKICLPSEDIWMLQGPKNADALAEVKALKLESKTNGIVSGVLGTDMYFVELRGGKVDPAFNLDGVNMI